MAGYPVPISRGLQDGDFVAAAVFDMTAAGMKSAAGRWIGWVGHFPLQNDPLVCA